MEECHPTTILAASSVRSVAGLSETLPAWSFPPLAFGGLPRPWPAANSSWIRLRRSIAAAAERAAGRVEPSTTDHDPAEAASCRRAEEDRDVDWTSFLPNRWRRRGGDQC